MEAHVNYIDPTKSSPANYRLLLDNDQVRVLEMNLKAGETDVQHSHQDETVYFITGSTVRIHLPNGQSVEANLPDGHVMWHEAWTHTVENIGSTDIRAIIVEDKRSTS
jgi:hypothetical protein